MHKQPRVHLGCCASPKLSSGGCFGDRSATRGMCIPSAHTGEWWRMLDAVKVHNPWCPERTVLCSGPAMCFTDTPAPREVCSPRHHSLMDVKGQSPQLAAEHHLSVTVCSLRLLQGSQTRGRTAWGLTQLPPIPGHPGSHLDGAVHAITLPPCQ